MNSFIDAFKFIGRNGQVPGEPPLPTLVHLTLETLKIAGIGVAISVLIALPVGLWLGHIHKGSFVAINLGNVWRALPSLAVLAIGVAFLGIGLRNVELALVVLAIPPIITNAYVAVDGVDRDVVDAARGMGLTGWEVLRQVELPLGDPADLRGDQDRRAVRRIDHHDRGADRIQRQPRRHHQQRDELSPVRGARRGDLHRRAGAGRGVRARRRAADADAGRAEGDGGG